MLDTCYGSVGVSSYIKCISLVLFCDLPCILESNPRPFYSFKGLKKSDAD